MILIISNLSQAYGLVVMRRQSEWRGGWRQGAYRGLGPA